MTCTRCQGRLLREHIYRHGAWWWRCYACGDRVDRTILLHRAMQAADTVDRQRAQERDLQEWADWLRTIPQPISESRARAGSCDYSL